ncbi:MAG TPA: hypothetical protein VG406_26750 [Isosphaeraceae bacterium]|nr:hypothetical protein [Isosphaeraceae bacterium]
MTPTVEHPLDLRRDLDAQGVPRRWPVGEWGRALAVLAERRRDGRDGEWPDELEAAIEGLLRATLRFARPGGAPVFAPEGARPEVAAALRFWADRLSDPALSAVLARWSPGKKGVHGAPSLPAFACDDRPLAMLRADWSPRGDWLAIDHREPASCLVELAGLGQPWLGPSWSLGPELDPKGPPRPALWRTDSRADLAEWSFRTPIGRVTRTAVLLRGRRLALLADQVDGNLDEPTARLALAAGVAAVPALDNRALILSAGRGRSARVYPLGLPWPGSTTDRGRIGVEGGELVLRQKAQGRRCWLPWLVSWGADRNRRTTRWRTLTVAERSKACPPDVAFAARIAWGDGESLVVYRSLARPALRSFLGHQTGARFLVGLFTWAGDVHPLLTVED